LYFRCLFYLICIFIDNFLFIFTITIIITIVVVVVVNVVVIIIVWVHNQIIIILIISILTSISRHSVELIQFSHMSTFSKIFFYIQLICNVFVSTLTEEL